MNSAHINVVGTKTIRVGTSSNKVGLFTTSQIKELLGIATFDQNKFVASLMNGDYNAKNFYITGSYIDNGTLYFVPNIAILGDIRINYIFSYKI